MAFLAAAGGGTALSAFGQVFSAVSAYSAAKQNAAAQAQATADQVRAQEIRNRQRVGSQIALRAASGVTIDDGSPLLALEETLKIQEEDIDAIKRSGASRARAELMKGRTALFGGFARAGGTLLTRSHFKSQQRKATKINSGGGLFGDGV